MAPLAPLLAVVRLPWICVHREYQKITDSTAQYVATERFDHRPGYGGSAPRPGQSSTMIDT